MGFVKFHEDIIDSIYERKNNNGENITLFPIKIDYDCYYCNESFPNFQDRIKHVRKYHNVPDPLLMINGRIIADQFYIDSIYSANIVMCGYKNLVIYFNDQIIEYEEKDTEINLISFFKNVENNVYNISIGNKKYVIYKYKNLNIENVFINGIIKNWETQMSKNEDLVSLNNLKSINETELLYLKGIFEYFVAAKEKINPTDRKKRYEIAFTILSSFNNLPPKAYFLLKVIAFRFNWFEKLESLSKVSKGVFDIVIDFYKDIKSDKNKFQQMKEGKQQIYVENDIQECLNAIKAYQNENWVEVDVYLSNWSDEKLEDILDYNKKDRILLLKARNMKRVSNYSAAKKYYSKIKSPLLKKEAEIFNLNN
jgi:hypothetical protein